MNCVSDRNEPSFPLFCAWVSSASSDSSRWSKASSESAFTIKYQPLEPVSNTRADSISFLSIDGDIDFETPVQHDQLYAQLLSEIRHGERYWLTKSVKMWGNEKNEYAYIFTADSFTPELAERCVEWAWEDGIPRVKPHSEHQCTNVKVIFIADSVSPETEKAVKKMSRTKNYRFGLHGYSNLLTGITDLGTEKNRKAKKRF